MISEISAAVREKSIRAKIALSAKESSITIRGLYTRNAAYEKLGELDLGTPADTKELYILVSVLNINICGPPE